MAIETDRLLLRRPIEADRNRFVELFTDEGFMVFGASLDAGAASVRFENMLELSGLIEYAKQPVVDRRWRVTAPGPVLSAHGPHLTLGDLTSLNTRACRTARCLSSQRPGRRC